MLPPPIYSFIKKHHVLTLSTFSEGEIWVSHCFYAFDEDNVRFIVISNLDTIHARHMLINPDVAIGIALETRVVGKIKGLQIKAKAYPVPNEEEPVVRKIYLRRFPYAILYTKTTFWSLNVMYAKLTDNQIGFGKKLIWEKEKM